MIVEVFGSESPNVKQADNTTKESETSELASNHGVGFVLRLVPHSGIWGPKLFFSTLFTDTIDRYF